MCGHVGIAGKLLAKDEQLIKKMLLWDWLRGPDATGLAAVRNTKEVQIAKVSDHPLALFEMSSFNRALNGNDSTVFMGHNRASTRGKNNHGNTHPFEFGDIVGAHNGTLDWKSHQNLENKLGEKYDVDSQALIASIARFGLKETISMIEGSWSIVYYDKSEDTLNFIRNKERPMWYAYSKEFDRLFWSSDYEFIRSAINLQGGYTLYTTNKSIGYFTTDVDTHYKWNVEDLRNPNGKLPKPKTRKIEGKKYVPANGGGHGHGFFPTRDGNGGSHRSSGSQISGIGTGTQSTGSSSRRHHGNKDKEELKLVGNPSKPFNDWYGFEEFKKRTPYGCSWCSTPVEWGAHGIIINERDGSVLGPCCTGSVKRNVVNTKSLYLSGE